METIDKIIDICNEHVHCDECPYETNKYGHCLFEEFPARWDLEKIKEVINGSEKDRTIPFLLHKETGCPIDACVEAYDKAIEYLRSKSKVKGGVEDGSSNN